MSTLHLTEEMIARVDRWGARFHAARMGALAELPGNPYGVEIRQLSIGSACKIRHSLLRGKNRIIGFTPDDLPRLDELVRFYQQDALRFTLSVLHGRMTPELFRRLVQAGLWSAGSGVVPALDPSAPMVFEANSGAGANIHVRRS